MRKIHKLAPALLLFSLAACQNADIKGAMAPERFSGAREAVSSEITGSVKPTQASQSTGENAALAKNGKRTASHTPKVDHGTGEKTVIHSYRPPRVGTIFGWRNNWASLEPKLVYRVASVSDIFDGKIAMRFDAIEGTGRGARTYYDPKSSNLVGHRDISGKPLVTYQKVENRLKFPMRPGDKWVANWKLLNHKSKKVVSGGGVVKVIGVEVLNTDAGRFKTMKVRLPLPPTAGRGMRHHIWYSPKLGIIVREQISNNIFSWVKEIERVELAQN